MTNDEILGNDSPSTNEQIFASHGSNKDLVLFQTVVVDKFYSQAAVVSLVSRVEAEAAIKQTPAQQAAARFEEMKRIYGERMAMLDVGGSDPYGREEWKHIMQRLGR